MQPTLFFALRKIDSEENVSGAAVRGWLVGGKARIRRARDAVVDRDDRSFHSGTTSSTGFSIVFDRVPDGWLRLEVTPKDHWPLEFLIPLPDGKEPR